MDLREYLSKNNITRKEFAYKCRINQCVLYGILRGENCSFKTAKKIYVHSKKQVVITNIRKPELIKNFVENDLKED